MGVETVVTVASLVPAATAVVFRLAYRDYLRAHHAFVRAMREMHETAPLPADTVAALAPVPPWRRRPVRG